MKRCAAAVLSCAALALIAGCDRAGTPYAPCTDCNVVLISVDTLRADHVGALGYGRPTTPEIDALARRGVLFENAISQSSWTRPAHMSILTGLHPREHGFVALADHRRLDPSIPTLAGVLRDHGYTTAAFVGGVNVAASFGFDEGFGVYRSNGKYFRDNLEDLRYWLDHERSGKFFLFLHGYDAHTPYFGETVDRRALGLADKRPEVSHGTVCRGAGPRSRIRPFIDEYDAAVHRADRYVGKLVRELETRDLLHRTIVVLLSDHGEEFLEHDRCFHIATLYREVLHVPVLLVAPGLATRRVREVVSASVSIAPTIMQMLGIERHPFPAPSLLAAATGGAAPREAVVSETERRADKRGDGHVRALTTARDKLIHFTTESRFELFDAAGDAAEQHVLDAPARSKPLADELDRWAAAHPSRESPRRNEPRGRATTKEDKKSEREKRQREEELRSLGYAE